MSISSEIRRAGPFAGNGATVAFPFTFKVFTTPQVVVTRTVSGADTTLTLTTDYTVTLNSDQDTSPGGTVTMLTAPATGQSITITSNVANLQPTVLANLGGFYPEVINDSLDRATIQIQQLDERLDRALVIPVSSSGVSTQLPVPEAGKILGWNNSGTAVMNYTTTPPSGELYPAATYAALTAIPAANRQDDMLVYVASRATDGDGGDGWWRFDAASSATANGGTILAPDAGTGRWFRIDNNNPTLEQFGGGAGVEASDQVAIAAVAALGAMVTLKRGVTYYMTAGVTPVSGFGMIFEPGAKIVARTQASGSGSAGFKNYSGLAASRNSTSSTMFMLTAAGGQFTLVDPVFEGDNNNQPILRPIYANGSYLYIKGKVTVTNMNAANGCLSLDQMLGGYVEGYDLRANADMVDSAYTNLTNYNPTGIVFDDDGTFRSSRMTFGPGVIKAFNRDAGGSAPTESDGITIGGIGKALRSGAIGGQVFGPIYVEDMGEGVDCMHDDCVFESITARSCTLFGAKFVHGAQSNVVQWLDVDGYGTAAVTFAGSSATATATRDNVILDGIVRNGGKVGSGEVSCVLFQENGGTGVARANRVELREAVVDSDTDYLAKDNHATTGLDNRVRIQQVTGALATSAAAATELSNLKLKVGGGLTRLTMSADQTGLTTATNTTVLFNTAETDLLSEAVTASNKIRSKYPGRKLIRASLRATLNTDDDVKVRLLQNGTLIALSEDESISGSSEHTFTVERMIYVNENQAGTSSADFTIQAQITSSGSIGIASTAVASFFELMDVD
jgi:hypothetical protein